MSPSVSADYLYFLAEEARKLASPCRLCPRACGVDRLSGESGYCGAGIDPKTAAVTPHFGEEPPLTVGGGAGTIFFSHCNLRCVFCQNYQISSQGMGSIITPAELAQGIIDLGKKDCCNIEAVSPSHHLPGLLEALARASEQGIDLPFVYNSNGYESPETLDLLNGVVDVYLPDIKYGSDENASRFSDVDDYVSTARTAVLKMHSQVGDLKLDGAGCAIKGLILRHLVLPENVAGTTETLWWISDNFSHSINISLMAQYSPLKDSFKHPPLNRKLLQREYDDAVDLAWDLGLKNVFIQEIESQDAGIPDFAKDSPFSWD